MPRVLHALLVPALALALLGPAAAFESPPTARAEAVLGGEASGPNYRVDPVVQSDGLLHIFVLHTAYGTFQVAGEDLMRERIRELAALRALQAMSESDVFVKAVGQTATGPLRFGEDLLTDPKATLQNSVSGVAQMFDRIGAGLSNPDARRDSFAGGVLGLDAARRALAVQLGVDPYTDFPPLAAKLREVANAAALGGLSVKALMIAIPGGAGIAVGGTSAVNGLRDALAEKTAAQIVVMVKRQLLSLRVPADLIGHFVDNRAYTPSDLLVIAQALSQMRVGGEAVFIARAAEAGTRDEAFFQRRRAELLAERAKALGIGPFVSAGGFPLNQLKTGGTIALFPLDEVSWTEHVARSFEAVAKAVAGEPGKSALAITGTLTPEARANITRLGWTVQKVP